MIEIAVVLAGTRPGRRGEPVAGWVLKHAAQRDDAGFELVDLAEVDQPHLDEPMPPATGRRHATSGQRVDDLDGARRTVRIG